MTSAAQNEGGIIGRLLNLKMNFKYNVHVHFLGKHPRSLTTQPAGATTTTSQLEDTNSYTTTKTANNMGISAMIIGGISGTGMHMMNNALQKVPLSRSECMTTVCVRVILVVVAGVFESRQGRVDAYRR